MEIWRLLLIGFDCFRLLARQTLGTHLSFIIDHTYLSHHKRHRNLISKLYTDGSLSRHCATSPWSFVLYDNSAIGKECQQMMWFLVDFVILFPTIWVCAHTPGCRTLVTNAAASYLAPCHAGVVEKNLNAMKKPNCWSLSSSSFAKALITVSFSWQIHIFQFDCTSSVKLSTNAILSPVGVQSPRRTIIFVVCASFCER